MKRAIAILAAVALSGCITTDKLRFKMALDDYQPTGQVDAEGNAIESQTNLVIDTKGGAGDVIASIQDLDYTWRNDGAGWIRMNAGNTADATARIEGITAQQDRLATAIQRISANVIALGSLFVPVPGAADPEPQPGDELNAQRILEALMQALRDRQ